jgi:hypothetical protein
MSAFPVNCIGDWQPKPPNRASAEQACQPAACQLIERSLLRGSMRPAQGPDNLLG